MDGKAMPFFPQCHRTSEETWPHYTSPRTGSIRSSQGRSSWMCAIPNRRALASASCPRVPDAASFTLSTRAGDSADPGTGKDALCETVTREVLVRCERLWKPGTLKVNRTYLHRQILPCFAGRKISAITRQDVAAWFRSVQATPAAANRSAPVLSVIMLKAESWDYRPENAKCP